MWRFQVWRRSLAERCSGNQRSPSRSRSIVSIRVDFAVNYGVTDALAPFPLHSLVSVMSATINNNTVSFNAQETLPLLLRMVDPEEFATDDCMTPTALDFPAHYTDAIQAMDWQLDVPTGTLPKNKPFMRLVTMMWSLVTERMPGPASAPLATFPTQTTS